MEVLKVEHIMKGILLWEPLYLTGLQVSAKDHYEYILKNRERPYEPMDMYYFLNPEQVKQLGSHCSQIFPFLKNPVGQSL